MKKYLIASALMALLASTTLPLYAAEAGAGEGAPVQIKQEKKTMVHKKHHHKAKKGTHEATPVKSTPAPAAQ